MVAEYSGEVEKLRERIRVANAMRILKQKREAGGADDAKKGDAEESGVECPNCGNVVKKKGAKFCSKCRSPLSGGATDVGTGGDAGKKKVVGRRQSLEVKHGKIGSVRKKDPKRAPVTMQNIKGLLAAHEPCLLCSWYNPTDANTCAKC